MRTVRGLRGMSLFVVAMLTGCLSGNLAGNAGTGGIEGSGGAIGTGGAQGAGASSGTDTVPSEWGDASVEAGVDCLADATVCGGDAFCGIAEFNGASREHRCFSKGNCDTCECLAKTFSAFYDQHSTTDSLRGATCWCSTSAASPSDHTTTKDAAAAPVAVVKCLNG